MIVNLGLFEGGSVRSRLNQGCQLPLSMGHALKELSTMGFNGHVFVPEDRGGEFKEVIAHEVEEETGLRLDPERFTRHETRQSLATLSAHVTHLFSAELTEDELILLRSQLPLLKGRGLKERD